MISAVHLSQFSNIRIRPIPASSREPYSQLPRDGEFLYAPFQNPSPASCSAGDEVREVDVFYAGDDSSDANHPQRQPSTPSSFYAAPHPRPPETPLRVRPAG
ncbi:hypothetical protein SAY87_013800 [Trapa incisa]|uniref:Uncharacterized protein n=1 Tax=Trapa incisa TaxID=236973 RepID=A0AAN7KJ98_9MYRT|nr:hypothetical protein SAY87_013800 [Trapa incisa]